MSKKNEEVLWGSDGDGSNDVRNERDCFLQRKPGGKRHGQSLLQRLMTKGTVTL